MSWKQRHWSASTSQGQSGSGPHACPAPGSSCMSFRCLGLLPAFPLFSLPEHSLVLSLYPTAPAGELCAHTCYCFSFITITTVTTVTTVKITSLVKQRSKSFVQSALRSPFSLKVWTDVRRARPIVRGPLGNRCR